MLCVETSMYRIPTFLLQKLQSVSSPSRVLDWPMLSCAVRHATEPIPPKRAALEEKVIVVYLGEFWMRMLLEDRVSVSPIDIKFFCSGMASRPSIDPQTSYFLHF